ncbi:hypothetical protein C0J52_07476 [Blattella germanica]|nr:hypothetical protein C0J52_07476 [Blattella germanica]
MYICLITIFQCVFTCYNETVGNPVQLNAVPSVELKWKSNFFPVTLGWCSVTYSLKSVSPLTSPQGTGSPLQSPNSVLGCSNTRVNEMSLLQVIQYTEPLKEHLTCSED